MRKSGGEFRAWVIIREFGGGVGTHSSHVIRASCLIHWAERRRSV